MPALPVTPITRSIAIASAFSFLLIVGCDCRKQRSSSSSTVATQAGDIVTVPVVTTSPASAVEAVELLGNSIQGRLELIPDVARFKWNNKRPVSDPEREEQLLTALTQKAVKHGVSETLSRRFFAAQIAAARQVQERLISEWKTADAAPFADVPDLTSQLRPRIDEVSESMLQPLATLESVLNDEATAELLTNALQQRLNAAPQFEAELKTAFQPLLHRANP